jgi:hypothetical protein
MVKKGTCDAHGNHEKLRSGKTCSAGHFIRYSCWREGLFTSS